MTDEVQYKEDMKKAFLTGAAWRQGYEDHDAISREAEEPEFYEYDDRDPAGDVFWSVFKTIWIVTTILGGLLGFFTSGGQFAATLVWLVIGCVAGMALGFWLPIIGAFAAVAFALWLLLKIFGG